MTEPTPHTAPSRRSAWLAILAGWLSQLALITMLPILVQVLAHLVSPDTVQSVSSTTGPTPSTHPLWLVEQGAIFAGSILAGLFAARLAPPRSLAVPLTLVFLSLLTTTFQQFPAPMTRSVAWIWVAGPTVGMLFGVLLGRWLTRQPA